MSGIYTIIPDLFEVLGSPRSKSTNTAFRDKAMNMGIPFKVSAEGMKNTNETGSKALGLVFLVKHTSNNRVDGIKEAVE